MDEQRSGFGRRGMGRLGRIATLLIASTMLVTVAACASNTSSPGDDATALDDAAVQAYIYTYPLVANEVTRREMTNLPRPNGMGAAPMNQLANITGLPDASYTSIPRPNDDTVYSMMFFDVSTQPMVVNVPDMGGRYHLFPLLDAWTNVDASPGTRTLGEQHGYQFAITGPSWHGTLPAGVRQYSMPTDSGWMIGRIQVNGKDDMQNVLAIQHQLTAVPLSEYGKDYTQPVNTDIHPDWPSGQRVPTYIRNLTPQQYWDLYYDSLSHDQPRPEDKDLLAGLAKVGWSPEHKLDLSRLSDSDRARWSDAWTKALPQIEGNPTTQPVNGWRTQRSHVGDYGTAWLDRAVVACIGIGANLPQDAVYPITSVDSNGDPLTSDRRYILHFDKNAIPDVRAFWSLTLYNDKGFFVDNPLNRYSLRGGTLHTNPDGSIDIYLQRQAPGADRDANWLPTPSSGTFNLALRLYWPDTAIVDGTWNPPAITAIS
ncbi:DUF1254 domain-containing protein [Nocardia sp. NBC_00403]|uniref:DUF1254 domain-containing protein n=1 Tax=Nocardia sp. NBC_00403 TaxID=2975990 RepID=UPI002E235E7D